MKKRTSGFTLIELVIAMAVVAIGLAITIPTMRDFTNVNRQAEQINRFVRDLNYSKAEAVTRGRTLTIACTGASWENGWTITDPTTGDTLRTAPAFTVAGLTLIPAGGVCTLNFRPDGTVSATFTADLCAAGTATDNTDKQITVSTTGRVSLDAQFNGCP